MRLAPIRLPQPLLVVSPHPDDAVLSCGRVLGAHPGAVVVTLFGGSPPDGTSLPSWDRDAGFKTCTDAVAARRTEDEQALAGLDATGVWLEFVDHQYGQPEPSPHAIGISLNRVIAAVRPGTVLTPLGLDHPDHRSTAAAIPALALGARGITWIAYEEALYRGTPTVHSDRAIAAFRDAGLTLQAVVPVADPSPEAKRAALACYRSQVRACLRRRVPMMAEAVIPERFWRLQSAAPPGPSQP